MANLFAEPALSIVLARQLHALGRHAGHGRGLRAWVAGCGTGEDAYAAAILLVEAAEQQAAPLAFTIFATDADQERLTAARAGIYTPAQFDGLAPAQLERFFFAQGAEHHVKSVLREQVVFASHSLLKDPPFSNLDLIVCRDLLATLTAEQRAEALRRFAFGLRRGGILLLGPEPALPADEPRFDCVEAGHPLFARTAVAAYDYERADELSVAQERQPPARALDRPVVHPRHAGLIVDHEDQVVRLGGGVERFLRIAPGRPSFSLPAVVRPELHEALSETLIRARASDRAAESLPASLDVDGTALPVTIVAQPLSAAEGGEGELMVLFDISDVRRPAAGAVSAPPRTIPAELAILQARHDVVYEELRITNEELRITNEELRISTEELVSRREELHSMNKQLQLINQELQQALAALIRTNADLENLIASTEIGAMFLDRALHVQRYTAPVQQIVNLLPDDVGRPLSHVTHQLAYEGLLADAAAVLADLRPVEREARHADGRWFLVRLQPYRTAGHQVTGVAVAFLDISRRKQAEEALQRSYDELELRITERTAELVQSHRARQKLLRQLVNAQEAERLRIARELHDTFGQQITAVLLGLKAAREQTAGHAAAQERLEQVWEIVQAMSRDLHETAVSLRPTALDDVGLADALRSYVEQWSCRTGIVAELFVTGLGTNGLPPEIETALYRLTQEALTNVARHAEASHVSVVLEGSPSRVVAVIEDDGKGFTVESTLQTAQGHGRLGLVGMQERAALVGGTLTLESVPGAGTTVIARIPL